MYVEFVWVCVCVCVCVFVNFNRFSCVLLLGLVVIFYRSIVFFSIIFSQF